MDRRRREYISPDIEAVIDLLDDIERDDNRGKADDHIRNLQNEVRTKLFILDRARRHE